MKGQDKLWEKQLSKGEMGNIPEKEFRIMSEDDLGAQKKNGEYTRNVNQRPKELTNGDERYAAQLLSCAQTTH